MKKLLAILSVALFANQASAWELFGLNENTKLEDLKVLEKKYSNNSKTFFYYITPPSPNPLGNEYKIQYSKKHGICSVEMWAGWDLPYPYGKTRLSTEDFGVALYNDWQKLESILLEKYGNKTPRAGDTYKDARVYSWWGDELKRHGFQSIDVQIPGSRGYLWSGLRYVIDIPWCMSFAEKDAAEQNAESMGVSSDDF